MEQTQIHVGDEKKSMKKSKFLKWILALGIVIVLNLLFNYGIRTFYKPAPDYADFCRQEQVTVVPENQEECVSQGGSWTTNPSYGKTYRGYCNTQFKCSNDYQGASDRYNRNAFIIWVILGIIAIITSFYLAHVEAVSLGLSLGGVVAIIVGAVSYWSNMNDKLRFAVLLVGLVALIWLGVKKIRD
ncbi:MAG TPA: hypothetical protein VJK09_03060 [Candidatus Paceibacterota bacterium]